MRNLFDLLSGGAFQKQGNLFVAEEDIKKIPRFADETLLAVRAPHGTTLEVPDPDEGMEYPKKRYQIFLKSSTGPVEVFLVSLQDKIDEELGKSEPRLSPPLGASIPESFALSPAITMDAEDGRKMRSQKTLAAENPDNQPRTMAPKSNSESQPGHLETTVAEGHSTVPVSESLGNSQAFLRIMPPSCDPDYWFSDEGKELGLSDMFYTSGVNGAHPLC